jgi:endo-1,4-beta-D-glucanase Y
MIRSSSAPFHLSLLALLLAPLACGTPGPKKFDVDDTGGSGGATGGKGGKGGSNATGGNGGDDNPGGAGGEDSGGAGGDAGGKGGGGGGKGGASGGQGGGGGGMGGTVTFMPSAPKHPFGSHTFKYPDGVLKPSMTQQQLDDAVKAYYEKWKAKYLVARCGGYVVLTEGGTGAADGTFSVSEGHGYGMVITALMAGYDAKAQDEFNGLHAVFRHFPSSNTGDLMDWQLLTKCPKGETCQEPMPGCFRIDGPASGSATDGDMDIGFALLLADKQWGSNGAYLSEAQKVIAAIKGKDMNAMTKLPLLADDIGPGDMMYYTTRPSDFMLDHFRSFGKATSDPFWMQSVESIQGLLGGIQKNFTPMTGLIPDFVVDTNTAAPKPAPPMWPADEGTTTGEYAYNSCRVPWRMATDFIASGDARSRNVIKAMNTWIKSYTSNMAKNIIDGYTLEGRISNSAGAFDLSFTAPFAVSAIADTDQGWLDQLWTSVDTAPLSSYFGDTIKMISMIVISQNWWTPQ